MKEYIEARAKEEAIYILTTKDTIRATAIKFKVSKSTICKDITERLPMLDDEMFKKVDLIMKEHIATRHIKGGISTCNKYRRIRNGVKLC